MTFGQHSNIVKSNVGVVISNVKCYEIFYNTADWNNYSYKVLARFFCPYAEQKQLCMYQAEAW